MCVSIRDTYFVCVIYIYTDLYRTIYVSNRLVIYGLQLQQTKPYNFGSDPIYIYVPKGPKDPIIGYLGLG